MLDVDPDEWPRVEHAGRVYAVAPRYIHGVSMRDAESIASFHGCELPTRELVDAIWLIADCKLEPITRKPDSRMISVVVSEDQRRAIERQIAEWTVRNGRAPTIVAGSHKDVVRRTDGRLAIYGWHMPSGERRQKGASTAHSLDYVDYSQGVRLIKRLV